MARLPATALQNGNYMPHAVKKASRADKIVQAAARLFAYQGYHGTSTRQIAHLANVSENTLFRHFDHKEELFWSALGSHAAALELEKGLVEKITKYEPPEVVLPKLLELLTDTVFYRPELLRLIAVAFLEMQPKAEAFIQDHFSPILSAISHYFELSIRNGKVRQMDSTTLTAALMMTSLTHAGVSKLINRRGPLLSPHEVNRIHTRFWLDMLAPEKSPRPPSETHAG